MDAPLARSQEKRLWIPRPTSLELDNIESPLIEPTRIPSLGQAWNPFLGLSNLLFLILFLLSFLEHLSCKVQKVFFSWFYYSFPLTGDRFCWTPWCYPNGQIVSQEEAMDTYSQPPSWIANVVNAKPKAPILLGFKQDGRAIGRAWWSYESMLKHTLYLFF